MSTKVLICDDSGFARKQMARSIPDGWEVEISFAENGQQAIEMIKLGKADVMFLDLNMPVMDGYQTMQIIKEQDLPTMVIVVSGDVQSQARVRMMQMGALDFIRKPVDNEKLTTILAQYGIYTGVPSASQTDSVDTSTPHSSTSNPVSKTAFAAPSITKVPLAEKLDAYREMANVAMGQAGEKLAKLLNEFIDLPIPNVNLIETTELHMAMAEISHNDSVSAISQGFISAGINGEAILIFNDSNFINMVKLLNYKQAKLDESLELEALMDVTNILVSACLTALSDQLNVKFTHNHPIILGQHCGLEELLENNVSRWNQVLAIEIAYAIKTKSINFDLLLLFPDKSIDLMYEKLVEGG
ncbi:response regulator [Aliiglaciecola lipolytica]|uniref:Response regulator n=1 Tax=Aliiglaciecola lipolytica E3 TaxID=1127673 RepID=K6XYW2_9ALTE|nr:response regulator [Aliiglaciecola lipolytica]GAC16806.1 response regulator [Aliiglaciecola lipolytica E3]